MSTTSEQLNTKTVLNLLRAEIAIQRKHLDLLIEQRTALLANDSQAFAVAHVKYELFGGELDAHAAMRRATLGSDDVSIRAMVAEWPKNEKAAATAMLDRLAGMVTRLKNIADQNTAMVSNQLMYTQFMLSVMVRAGRRSMGYARPLTPPSTYTENVFINQVA